MGSFVCFKEANKLLCIMSWAAFSLKIVDQLFGVLTLQ